jgi:muramoyltetrapeptide carboxypeptidase
MGTIIKPACLQPGDKVGIISPASAADPEKLKQAIRFLESLGLQVCLGQSLKKKRGYLAGTDQERLDDLHQMFADQEIKAVICARGGYGTGRIASAIDYGLIRENPKIFWGYSDITFLLNAIFQKTGLVTFHGPMLTSDVANDDVHPLTLQTFQQLFVPQTLRFDESISPLETMVEGEASGPIVGGNLSLMVSMLGTEFDIDTKDKLLFIEEIDEEPYRVDRMLNQLKMAGKLEQAAGILVCDFNNCGPDKEKDSLSLEEVLNDYIVPAGKPALRGFAIGHCSPNLAVPVGVTGRLSTYEKSFTVEQPGVIRSSDSGIA